MNSKTNIHLRVVGSLLENSKIYRRPHLEAIKDLALQIMREFGSNSVSLHEIHGILCYEDIPLVPENVLRQALNSLLRQDEKIEYVDKKKRVYRLLVDVPVPTNLLEEQLENCWSRHFSTCDGVEVDVFRRAVALLFARYGCAAYETLTLNDPTTVRLSDIVDSISLPSSIRNEFCECFSDFVLSQDPVDAKLKVRLASTYALLRMNGAGNWDADELRNFFAGKRFLLDTNVLFEFIGRTNGQTSKMLEILSALEATFIIGEETIKEFDTALRTTAKQVIEIIEQGIDLKRLVDTNVLSSDWIIALFEDENLPSRDQILNRIDQLVTAVISTLDSSGVKRIYLERETTDEQRRERIESIQEFALETRHFTKHESVALHDALLWEAVDHLQFADLILTMDRSLGRIRVNNRRVAIMLDDVVACALIGGAGEQELCGLFNHTLSMDLHQEASFLNVQDIQAIANMESTLLSGPVRALRQAAKRLAELKNERLRTGEPIPPDEISRILVSSISSYRDDRACAIREKEQRQIECDKRKEAEEKLRSVEMELIDSENERLSHNRRLASLEARCGELEKEKASFKADYEAQKQQKTAADRNAQLNKESANRRRDWMLFCLFLCILSGLLLYFGFTWSAGFLGFIIIVSLGWAALAQETPRISLALLTLIVAIITGTIAFIKDGQQTRDALDVLYENTIGTEKK